VLEIESRTPIEEPLVLNKTSMKFSHVKPGDTNFIGEGLRDFFSYRDLGIAEATAGKVLAQLVRSDNAPEKGTGWHYHGADFHIVYMLKGWARFMYEDRETLVEAGYAPEMAYFECVHEVKLIVDLIYEGGIANMNYSVSNTAEYGEYVSGPRVVNAETKAEMKRILADITSGKFTRDWMLENKVNQTSFKATRAKLAEHPIEQVGAKLREMMPWIKQRALVDKSKN